MIKDRHYAVIYKETPVGVVMLSGRGTLKILPELVRARQDECSLREMSPEEIWDLTQRLEAARKSKQDYM